MAGFHRVFLKPGEETSLLRGFPWVYEGGVDHATTDSGVVEVFSKTGSFLGTGFLSCQSKIAVRILSTGRAAALFGSNQNIHDPKVTAHFATLFLRAYELRRSYYGAEDSFRLVFSESDFFPGVVVDLFTDISGETFFVIQFLSMAAETFKAEILEALVSVSTEEGRPPRGVMERSDAPIRELEGLDWKKGPVYGDFDPLITITENGLHIKVDLGCGQKTGYFLDQKDNRRAAARFAPGKRVFDGCCHTGAFALNAAKAGAAQVIAVDISADAVAKAKENAALNGLDEIITVGEGNVFDLLRNYYRDRERFDTIILDPPAFAKNSRSLETAFGGYKEINLRAMKLLNPGGTLITCSCSGVFSPLKFYDMLSQAAADARKTIQVMEKRSAGPDHPLLAGFPKSEYLKCGILRVF